MEKVEMTYEQWEKKGRELFGENKFNWRFVCPVCKHVASVRDWQQAGLPETTVAFSCVGRGMENPRKAFDGKGSGPCDYAGGGLFELNPVTITKPDGTTGDFFAFAEPEQA